MRRRKVKMMSLFLSLSLCAGLASLPATAAESAQRKEMAGSTPEETAETAGKEMSQKVVQAACSSWSGIYNRYEPMNCAAVVGADGGLWTWGCNDTGQLGYETDYDEWGTDVMMPCLAPHRIMDNVTEVGLSCRAGAAIQSDGSLWFWGDNGSGLTPTPYKIMDNVAQVVLSSDFTAAVTTDGGLWTWGNNSYGQLGYVTGYDREGNLQPSPTPHKILDHVTQVALSSEFAAAVTTDGGLWTWGQNDRGQLGYRTDLGFHEIMQPSPAPNRILDHVTDVSLGTCSAAAVTSDGGLWTWGANEFGQLGHVTDLTANEAGEQYMEDCPEPVRILDDAVSVVSSFNPGSSSMPFETSYAAILSDNSLWTWGSNDNGQLGYETTLVTDSFGWPAMTYNLYPRRVMEDVSCVAFNDTARTAAIKTDGSLWTWGNNNGNKLGYEGGQHYSLDSWFGFRPPSYADDEIIISPTPRKLLDDVASIAWNEGYGMAVRSDGSLWTWGILINRNEDLLYDRYEIPLSRMYLMPFADALQGSWYYEAAWDVYNRGIMTGLDETHFGPSTNLSRAQFATILYRLEGEPDVEYSEKFPDVPDGEFYSRAVMWASSDEVGVITGYTEGRRKGRFGPADRITREQLATMLYRYADLKGMDTTVEISRNDFPDSGRVSTFAHTAMSWAVDRGLITGDQGKLNPQGFAGRAQCAAVLMRFLNTYR